VRERFTPPGNEVAVAVTRIHPARTPAKYSGCRSLHEYPTPHRRGANLTSEHKHCKDDPHCFNRYHFAIKPAARVSPGQLFVLETRDALDSDLTFDSTAQDVAAANLNLVHPLTGAVYIEGAKRGDAQTLSDLSAP
jgi:hypothetical protein